MWNYVINSLETDNCCDNMLGQFVHDPLSTGSNEDDPYIISSEDLLSGSNIYSQGTLSV